MFSVQEIKIVVEGTRIIRQTLKTGIFTIIIIPHCIGDCGQGFVLFGYVIIKNLENVVFISIFIGILDDVDAYSQAAVLVSS